MKRFGYRRSSIGIEEQALMFIANDNGLQLELVPTRAEISSSELPSFTAKFKNVSDVSLELCTYLLEHRLLTTLWTDTGLEVFAFQPTPRLALGQNDFKSMASGQQYEVKLDLKKSRADGYGLTPSGSLPPKVDFAMSIERLNPGFHEFTAHVGKFVSYYKSPPGYYSHQKDRIEILKSVERTADLTLSGQEWEGELTPKCQIRVV